jgi:pimeloyl-ACP methyl ester carboxylesterase
MIGISYGGYAAIVYASILPTKSLILVDPEPLSWVVDLENCIKNITAMIYYHRSLCPKDIFEFTKIRRELDKTSLLYYSLFIK